ncbi:hypothetical protein L1049_012426 [Liquidambar formosana]|uniref:Uncharacterized protein n=1 Tax=Liquidambar formosana TaxID=63359 RepID=A0AAP0N3N2_LIQFO
METTPPALMVVVSGSRVVTVPLSMAYMGNASKNFKRREDEPNNPEEGEIKRIDRRVDISSTADSSTNEKCIAISGPSPSKRKNGVENEVTGIGGIGDTIMKGCFKGIKNIEISHSGSPSLNRGVSKNVVHGLGGIGSTKFEDSFENIDSLKISPP